MLTLLLGVGAAKPALIMSSSVFESLFDGYRTIAQ